MKQYPNLKPWPKGVSGNPTGNPPIPTALRGIQSLTQIEVTKVVSKYARMTRAELAAAVADQSTPMLEVAIASVIANAAKNGDYMRLAFILDRAVGAVEGVVSPLMGLTDDELLRLVRGTPKELDAG